MTLTTEETRELYAVLDWAAGWMYETISDAKSVPQNASSQMHIRYYTPIYNTAQHIIDMMPWSDSGEGPFSSWKDAQEYVDSEFHATTRIRSTPDGWIIQTLTTGETT